MVSVPKLVGAVDSTRVEETQHLLCTQIFRHKADDSYRGKSCPVTCQSGGTGTALTTLNLGARRA
jgi:hypothetical protein